MATEWPIETTDGRVDVVLPPPLLAGDPPRLHSRRVAALHRRFVAAIDEAAIYCWPPSVDSLLLARLAPYYQALGALILPDGLAVRDLTQESRHQLLVATEPVEVPGTGRARGLSGLEQLLGYAYPTTASDEQGTGDDSTTTLAFALLVFDRANIVPLAQTLGPADLAAMAAYANRLRAAANEGDDKGRQSRAMAANLTPDNPEAPTATDTPEFASQRHAIAAHLSGLGIPLPGDFGG